MAKGKPRDTFLIPFPMSRLITPTKVMQNISTTSLFIPGYLVDYYNRRGTITVSAELQNAEILINLVDEMGLPIMPQPIVSVGNPNNDRAYRLTSRPAEISAYLRAAQNLVLCCFGRLVADDPNVTNPATTFTKLRHITMTLLLGELPP